MNANVTVTVYLDKRVEKSDKTFPLKIRLTWHRKRRLFALKKNMVNELLKEKESLSEFVYTGSGDYSIYEDSFEKATKEKARGKFADLKEVFQKITLNCQDIIKELPFFSFDTFQDALYYEKKSDPQFDVYGTFENYISRLKTESRIRTAVSYGCTLRSLKNFHNKKTLPFELVNVKFLNNYEKWMTGEQANSKTTVGIYMRQLRTIFNMRPKELSVLDYPFGPAKKNLYEIPKSKGRKIALNDADLKKLFSYEPDPNNGEVFYFDLWKLAYLLNGANIIDLLNLKSTNINSNFIEFERHKTKRNKTDQPLIKIPYNGQLKSIIEKYYKGNEGFLLPVFGDGMTAEQKDKAAQRIIWSINTHMKTIASKLELSQKKVTSYSSRHSFATRLMNLEAPITYISAQLGHTNIGTTKAYLDSFNDETIEKWQEKLTTF